MTAEQATTVIEGADLFIFAVCSEVPKFLAFVAQNWLTSVLPDCNQLAPNEDPATYEAVSGGQIVAQEFERDHLLFCMP